MCTKHLLIYLLGCTEVVYDLVRGGLEVYVMVPKFVVICWLASQLLRSFRQVMSVDGVPITYSALENVSGSLFM